jgi:glutathione S-transferase
MAHQPVTILGSYLSPYVRKVLVCLYLKGIDYVIDPVEPSLPIGEFSPVSTDRSVPVFLDGSVTISGCTVICEYLQDCYPEPALYPATPQARARARWLEEYANTRMGQVVFRRLFNERVIKRFRMAQEPDEAIVTRAQDIEMPLVLEYLETEFSNASPFLYGSLGLADIAVASFIRNANIAGVTIDAARWPAMHNVVTHAFEHPAFKALQVFEEISLRSPLRDQRDALAAAGAPVSRYDYSALETRRSTLAL